MVQPGVDKSYHYQPAIQGLLPILLSAATRQIRQVGNKCNNYPDDYATLGLIHVTLSPVVVGRESRGTGYGTYIDARNAKLLEEKKLGTDRQAETGSTIEASDRLDLAFYSNLLSISAPACTLASPWLSTGPSLGRTVSHTAARAHSFRHSIAKPSYNAAWYLPSCSLYLRSQDPVHAICYSKRELELKSLL